MSASHSKKPKLVLIAGPNGSGKTTFVSKASTVGQFGILVNADQIALSIARRKGEDKPSHETQFDAAKSAEEMRWALLSQHVSFATETVMSDKDRWMTFVAEAKDQGYQITLYFFTTVHPTINIDRVIERSLAGGHSVDASKIVSRYYKVMNEVLPVMLTKVDEAVLFDNSDPEMGAVGVLQLNNGKLIPLIDVDLLPQWAKSLLETF